MTDADKFKDMILVPRGTIEECARMFDWLVDDAITSLDGEVYTPLFSRKSQATICRALAAKLREIAAKPEGDHA